LIAGTALCVACACGTVDIARILLQHGANVNHTSRHSSPVIYASECRDVALASLLLEHGADIRTVPQGLQSYAAILPLYQVLLAFHGIITVAEILKCSLIK
jgi:ankyrin repeat protein